MQDSRGCIPREMMRLTTWSHVAPLPFSHFSGHRQKKDSWCKMNVNKRRDLKKGGIQRKQVGGVCELWWVGRQNVCMHILMFHAWMQVSLKCHSHFDNMVFKCHLEIFTSNKFKGFCYECIMAEWNIAHDLFLFWHNLEFPFNPICMVSDCELRSNTAPYRGERSSHAAYRNAPVKSEP